MSVRVINLKEKYMNHLIKKQLWYILVLLVLIYAVPLIYFLPVLTDSFITSLSASMLLLYNPAAILAISAVYGFKHRFKWYYLLMVPVLFVPSVFIFYNGSALIYALFYEVFCAAGLGLGVLLGITGTKKVKQQS